MPHVSGLGTIFAPGQAANVNAASDAIDSTISPGSNYFNSGNLGLGTAGTTGNTLLNGVAALGQTQVGFDPTAMNNDQAGLTSLSNLYYGLAQKGGMAEAAARENALAQMANLGTGGAGAGRAINAGSGDITMNAANIAAQERANNAAGSTQNDAAAAAVALQRAVYQAHVSHANHMTAIAASQYQNQLANMQANYNEELNNAAANARNQQATAYQTANNDTRQAALTAAQTIAAAGTTAGATIAAMDTDRKSTRLNSSHSGESRMPSSA